jgi:hypothetical protein
MTMQTAGVGQSPFEQLRADWMRIVARTVAELIEKDTPTDELREFFEYAMRKADLFAQEPIRVGPGLGVVAGPAAAEMLKRLFGDAPNDADAAGASTGPDVEITASEAPSCGFDDGPRVDEGEPITEETHFANIGKLVAILSLHEVGDWGDCSVNDPIVSLIDLQRPCHEIIDALATMSPDDVQGIIRQAGPAPVTWDPPSTLADRAQLSWSAMRPRLQPRA